MIEVLQTPEFDRWLSGLADRRAAAKIAQRIVRAQSGLLGDMKAVGDGVSEMRVDFGPGYRLYLVRRGAALIVLLCGGDKGSQRRDIARAKAMAKEI